MHKTSPTRCTPNQYRYSSWLGEVPDLITRAQTAGEYDVHVDATAHAIMFGGAVDALTAETLTNADFSLPEGAAALLVLIDAFTTSTPGAPGS